MIPKTIHLIWIGDQSRRPDRWIDTWRQHNPGFDVVVWDNDRVRSQSWMMGEQIDGWLNREIVGAVDILRWELLFRHGGLAFDADSECVRPLADWLYDVTCFAAWENEIARPGLIASGALGFPKHHPLLAKIMQDIKTDPNLHAGMAWQKTGPLRLTETLHAIKYTDMTIYPSHYFFPRHLTGLEYGGQGPVFAKQFWSSTHQMWGIDIGQDGAPVEPRPAAPELVPA